MCIKEGSSLTPESTGARRRRLTFSRPNLPGLKKEEVKVEIEIEDDRVLQISGERKIEKVDTGRFLRLFRLPGNAKMEEIKAAMESGILTVTVPKIDVKRRDVKAIDIPG